MRNNISHFYGYKAKGNSSKVLDSKISNWIHANDTPTNIILGKILVGLNQTREISGSREKSGFDSRLDYRILFIS